jgi:hypothetical protein
MTLVGIITVTIHLVAGCDDWQGSQGPIERRLPGPPECFSDSRHPQNVGAGELFLWLSHVAIVSRRAVEGHEPLVGARTALVAVFKGSRVLMASYI